MANTPKSKPQLTRENALKILKWKNIDLNKTPLVLLGVRGYYLDTMGVVGKNDRGIYDDAFFWITPTSFVAFNGNTDPSKYRKGKGTGSEKGMASLKKGAWLYKTGIHNGSVPHAAFRQAEDVTVVRDGLVADYEHTGQFGINIHRGGVNTTSSLGCQTVPPAQWEAFKPYGYNQISEMNLKNFIYLLVDEIDLRESGVLNTVSKVETPKPVIDTNNPDWGLIATLIKLDTEKSKLAELDSICEVIAKNKSRYQTVEKATKVPWYVIAIIHFREASLNFNCNLVNGQKLSMKTTIVPKGRGPYKTWEGAAVDAMEYSGLSKVKDWSFANVMRLLEKYNGLGYRKKGVLTPYVTAYTNMSLELGSYVADGKFDVKAQVKRAGAAAIYLKLKQRNLV